MREGVLVVFHLPPGSPKSGHNRFRWRIYGRDASSWGGKYAYHRSGFLDEMPHVLLYTGIVILRPEDGPALVGLVREEGGVAMTRRVVLEDEDREALKKKARAKKEG